MKKLLVPVSVAMAFFTVLLSLSYAATPARILTGRVLGRQDQPLAKAVVYLKNTKTLTVKTYISDLDGSYRFSQLSPDVDYEVYAEYNAARSDTKTLSAFDDRKQVNITLRIK